MAKLKSFLLNIFGHYRKIGSEYQFHRWWRIYNYYGVCTSVINMIGSACGDGSSLPELIKIMPVVWVVCIAQFLVSIFNFVCCCMSFCPFLPWGCQFIFYEFERLFGRTCLFLIISSCEYTCQSRYSTQKSRDYMKYLPKYVSTF